MTIADDPLAPTTEVGALGVYHLKRLWSRAVANRRGAQLGRNQEWQRDLLVIYGLGIGLEQMLGYLNKRELMFEDLEQWIADVTGGVDPLRIARLNAMLTGGEYPEEIRAMLAAVEAHEPVLSEQDLAFWEEHGYVILHDAVPEWSRRGAEEAIWEHLGAHPDDPDSWYVGNDHGIMVQYFQHPSFEANRRSPRIHKAFAQLWNTSDLWSTTDRVGFNVPERPGWLFSGPDLHWDVSLQLPIPFGLQGILYLTDTPPEQGAFTLVPGFHHRIDAWMAELPPGANPRNQDLHALGSKPIGGRAGDLIIWHQALPHGSRPNRGARPRMVQYINMLPTEMEYRERWL